MSVHMWLRTIDMPHHSLPSSVHPFILLHGGRRGLGCLGFRWPDADDLRPWFLPAVCAGPPTLVFQPRESVVNRGNYAPYPPSAAESFMSDVHSFIRSVH